MFSTSALLTLLSLSLTPFAAAQTCTPCDDVHFFLARGNNEPYPGRQGALVAATCDGLASCGYENLIYSALFTDEYCQTVYDGSIAGHIQLTAYAERCPSSKLILAGYSQGGQIATDILGGGAGTSFNGCVQPPTPALDATTSPGSKIVAVIVFGDVRHTANQAYNFGNGSSYDGLFPRTAPMLTALDSYTGVMRNWCLETDAICAGNQSNAFAGGHLDYYDLYSDAAASWIKSVASLTDDSSFQTVIPTSISGIVQNYATIGTATPSGTVRLAATTSPVIVCASTTTHASTSTHVSSTTHASSSSTPTTTRTSVPLSTSVPLAAVSKSSTTAITSSISIKAPTGSSSSSPASTSATSASSSAGISTSHVNNLGFLLSLGALIVIAM